MKFLGQAMLVFALIDSDRTVPLAITLEVFQPPMAKMMFICLILFPTFDIRDHG